MFVVIALLISQKEQDFVQKIYIDMNVERVILISALFVSEILPFANENTIYSPLTL